jgi:Ulp1 family protease
LTFLSVVDDGEREADYIQTPSGNFPKQSFHRLEDGVWANDDIIDFGLRSVYLLLKPIAEILMHSTIL